MGGSDSIKGKERFGIENGLEFVSLIDEEGNITESGSRSVKVVIIHRYILIFKVLIRNKAKMKCFFSELYKYIIYI